jgi:hypothetical protein
MKDEEAGADGRNRRQKAESIFHRSFDISHDFSFVIAEHFFVWVRVVSWIVPSLTKERSTKSHETTQK